MKVALIDYGAGNLHSLAKALVSGGAEVSVASSLAEAVRAEAVVLPGVGAFGPAAEQLAADRAALHSAVRAGLPCLGICLGMQLFFESSEEGGGAGLGLLGGRVRKLVSHRLPHMGWNEVQMADDALFSGIDSFTAYYANSFVAEPEDRSEVIAWSEYENERFAAAVRRDRVWGVQFHPEKSGAAGLKLLHNFLAQVPT
jgi:glutamine amidotransferase